MQATGPAGNNVLYAKMGPGGVLGDCPFTHKANFALRSKSLEFETALIDLSDKPGWYLEKLNAKGSVPTFVTAEGKILTESEDIIAFADTQGPPQLLSREGSEAAMEAVKGVFPAFAGYMKNKEEGEEADKKQALSDALAALNTYLEGAPGPLLLGADVCAEDCRVVGPLYHVSVAVIKYKEFDPLEPYPAVRAYLEALKKTEAFKLSSYTPETIEWGWSKFF